MAILCIALIEAAIVSVSEYWAFAGLWAGAVFCFGIFFPLHDTVMHETIDRIHAEKWRATILSLDSLVGNLMQGLACLSIAAAITEANIGQFFGIGSVALIACGGCYYLAGVVARNSQQVEFSDVLAQKVTTAL